MKNIWKKLTLIASMFGLIGALLLSPSRVNAAEAAKTLPVETKTLRIALYQGPGTGGDGPPDLMKQLNPTNAATSLVQVTPEQIRAGVLTNFDVVIFAGGSGSEEARAIGEDGRAQVENFVAAGGGYIGICAGAYLATSGYPWSLHIINARTLSPKWKRGRAVVKMELTPGGEKILGGPAKVDVLYHQGPIVGPANANDLPAYEPLAYFRTEIASNNTPAGIMINSPAVFAGQFKQGKVICISPHPEQTTGLEYLVPNAVNWVAPADFATR